MCPSTLSTVSFRSPEVVKENWHGLAEGQDVGAAEGPSDGAVVRATVVSIVESIVDVTRWASMVTTLCYLHLPREFIHDIVCLSLCRTLHVKSDNWIARVREGETWLHDSAKKQLIDDNACYRCR